MPLPLLLLPHRPHQKSIPVAVSVAVCVALALAHALALVAPVACALVVTASDSTSDSATATSNATASALLLRVVPLYSKPDFILFSLLFLPLHLQTAELFSQQKKDHVAAQKGRLSLVITSAEGEHIPSGEQHQIEGDPIFN